MRQAQVLRLYHAERWRIGTIATQLNLHRDTVARVLALAGLPPIEPAQRASMIDPYMPFIRQTLETFPKLTATRLYEMVQQRGYLGSASRFRQQIALCRPRPVAQAYLRLRTLPGEQAQCDWGHFGHIQIGQARRPLMAFVMVLSWSRQVFLQFFMNATTASFIRGHVAAFQAWQGVPRVVLYDNLKSAVLERKGDLIRFNPELLSLSAHYRFEPRPVAPARGNEKGRVERAIRYIRDAFFAGRQFDSLEDLNTQARLWCEQVAGERRCPEDATLTVRASATEVRILGDQGVIATHPRHYDRHQQVEQATHVADLVQYKRAARHHRAADRLLKALPECAALLTQAAERGEPLARTASTLMDLLQRYGVHEMRRAVQEAIAREVPHPKSVRGPRSVVRGRGRLPVVLQPPCRPVV